MVSCKYCEKENPQLKTINGAFCDDDCESYWIDDILTDGKHRICHGCDRIVFKSQITECELCGEPYCADCMASPIDDLEAHRNFCKGCCAQGSNLKELSGYIDEKGRFQCPVCGSTQFRVIQLSEYFWIQCFSDKYACAWDLYLPCPVTILDDDKGITYALKIEAQEKQRL